MFSGQTTHSRNHNHDPYHCNPIDCRDTDGKGGHRDPEDYLGGLEKLADTESGELSAFVIRAMLDNYKAAEEDRRAMCGDTGTPRWYVKYGNERASKAARRRWKVR